MLTVTPVSLIYRSLNAGPEGITVDVRATVADSQIGRVSATVDWQDGQVEAMPLAASPLTVVSTRKVTTGYYSVTVRAVNARYPVPDTAQAVFVIKVGSVTGVADTGALVFGPILPRDAGAPNAQQWVFDSGSDIGVLESSVKMLLSTQVGERLMSDYGTRLSAILFEPGIAGVESRVREEIVASLSAWEPRVRLLSATVDKREDRSVRVDLLLQSVLTEQNFGTFLEFKSA